MSGPARVLRQSPRLAQGVCRFPRIRSRLRWSGPLRHLWVCRKRGGASRGFVGRATRSPHARCFVARVLCAVGFHRLGKPRYDRIAGELVRYRTCERGCGFWTAESAVRRG